MKDKGSTFDRKDGGPRIGREWLTPRLIFLLFFAVMAVFYGVYVRKAPGDDLWLQDISKQYDLFSYVVWRYHTWSGRLPFEAMGYLFLGPLYFLWMWVNALMSALLAYAVYLYVSVGMHMRREMEMRCALLSCLCIGLIGPGVLVNATFWIAGTIVYLWPLTLAMIAFFPFLYAIRKVPLSRKSSAACFVCAVLVGWGQEQVSLCLFAFSACAIGYLFYRRKKVRPLLWTQAGAVLASIILSLTAPGDSQRFQSETATWFPTFSSLTAGQRVAMTLSWMGDRLINQTGMVLIFLWGALTLLLFRKGGHLAKALSAVSATACALSAFRMMPSSLLQNTPLGTAKTILFTFADFSKTPVSPAVALPYFVWALLLLSIPVSICLLYGRSRTTYFLLLLCGASLASAFVMTLSPTLYASGFRTMFVPSFLLLLALVLIVTRREFKRWMLLPFAAAFILTFAHLSWLWASGFYIW